MPSSPSLPDPSPDALAHSARLAELIAGRIAAAGGALPFDRFMELALYAPGLGYYSAGAARFGPAGDFVTAPELSPLFGRSLAVQLAELLDRLGGGDLLELGGGRGTLAAELLLELERRDCLPERYLLLEVGGALRAEQQARLQARAGHLLGRVAWLDRLPETGFRGVLFGNEVVDALPVSRFRIADDGVVEEQVVTAHGANGLALAWRPAAAPLAAAVDTLGPLPAGYRSEINLGLGSWLAALAAPLAAGAVLLIDYGYPRHEFYHPQRDRGTLMCHYRHRAHTDPLRHVGLQDITAHVDFTALAEAAVTAGLAVAGYTAQVHFLLGCGIDRWLAEVAGDGSAAQLTQAQAVRTLLMPGEMGERFQAMLLTRGIDPPLVGFSGPDWRARL